MIAKDISLRALKLSLAIYRVSGLLPAGEVMVRQLRRLGNEVVGDLVVDDLVAARKKIKVLRMYFKISQSQNWMREANWQILDQAYAELNQEISLLNKIEEKKSETKGEERAKGNRRMDMSHNIRGRLKKEDLSLFQAEVNQRQQKILDTLRANNQLHISDLIPLFQNDISARTLRNDLNFLINQGLVNKKGSNKFKVYFAK